VGRMVDFADVLTQVGGASAPDDAPRSVRVNTAGWDSWLQPEPEPRAPRPGSFYADLDLDAASADAEEPVESPRVTPPIREEILASAYTGPAEPETVAPQPVDLAAELAEARLQMLSPPELRALRRRLARRVHPDLPTADQPDHESMVRVNVAIDTALRDKTVHIQRR
jgi:hypothetical protein